MARVDAFLKLGREQGCSDVHLAVGTPPLLRHNGELSPIKYRDLTEQELESLVDEVWNDGYFKGVWHLKESGDE